MLLHVGLILDKNCINLYFKYDFDVPIIPIIALVIIVFIQACNNK